MQNRLNCFQRQIQLVYVCNSNSVIHATDIIVQSSHSLISQSLAMSVSFLVFGIRSKIDNSSPRHFQDNTNMANVDQSPACWTLVMS